MNRLPILLLFFLLLTIKYTNAIDFRTQPSKSTASPNVYLDVGEEALNAFIQNEVDVNLSYTTNPTENAHLQKIFGTGASTVFLKLNKLTFDFEENSATVNISILVGYDFQSTFTKTVMVNFSKTVDMQDLSYDISTSRIKLQINRLNEWHNYLLAAYPDLPDYVKTILEQNVSNTFIFWRDWVLGKLDPEFGLPDAPVYWQDPQLTIGFAFKDDYLQLTTIPHIEAESPRFELQGRLVNGDIQLRIIANAKYENVEIKQVILNGRTLSTNVVNITNRDGTGRNSRYYSDPFPAGLSSSLQYCVTGRFFNNKQLIYATWQINNIGADSSWEYYNNNASTTD
jgi:hypothetical protein